MMNIAFVFPGQGSQAVGMMAGYGAAPVLRETFAEAADVLGYDLWRLVSEGPADELNRTVHTQPAMLAAGVACYRLWRQQGGPEPQWMAGHSLGEYTALTCAGAMDFADALRLVRLRAHAMQSAVPEGSGAMAAILGLEDAAVREVCLQAGEDGVVEAVNFNAPGQVVIAGEAQAVARAMELARARGAKRALALPVSVPSHCSLMRPAAEALAEALAGVELRAPRVAVLHNVDVTAHETPEAIRAVLTRQLYSPVRWVETLQRMQAFGAQAVVECGPGKVLTGLNKRILPELPAFALSDAAAIEGALATIGKE
ncbi:MAG: ACP S-malonyltransferase [Thiobacillaceae bacterium]|nr:ACP S-malonyltransferase [Thiobacillaceae bacterium]